MGVCVVTALGDLSSISLVGMVRRRLALPVCGSPGFLGRVWTGGQAGNGTAPTRANTATRSSTQGQVAGIRKCLRRALRVSRAGTCRSR